MHTVERSRRRTRSADGVLAGLAGYLVAAGAADLLNPDWSPVESMVSHYVHARAGWLITVALLSLAAASAMLLRLVVAGTTGGRLGLCLLGVWTAGVLLGAVFPTDPYGQWDQPPTPAGMVHGTAGLIAVIVLPAAAVVLTRTWHRDIRWRPVARALTCTAALTVTTLAVLTVAFVDVLDGPSLPAGPWESLIGLAERLTLWSYVAWLATAALGLRRIIGHDQGLRGTGATGSGNSAQ